MQDLTMVRVIRRAMGCEFELLLCGQDRRHLLAAAEEAFEEVSRLEEQLSVFRPESEISYINALAVKEWVRVEPRLYGLLETASRLSQEMEGAFDITAGRLIDLWDSAESIPADIPKTTGEIVFDPDENAVRFSNPDMKLNLGAIGKGYAAQQIAELLVDRGVENALISAGPSTVYALGSPPDEDAWGVGIRNPVNQSERITSVLLKNRALSTSGSHQRFVEIEGRRYSHLIDPRTGRPAEGLLLASVITADPVEGEALSTAFFILGLEKAQEYCEAHPDVRVFLVREDWQGLGPEVITIGGVSQ
jgi:thiamine biosynthesis lipoprotein